MQGKSLNPCTMALALIYIMKLWGFGLEHKDALAQPTAAPLPFTSLDFPFSCQSLDGQRGFGWRGCPQSTSSTSMGWRDADRLTVFFKAAKSEIPSVKTVPSPALLVQDGFHPGTQALFGSQRGFGVQCFQISPGVAVDRTVSPVSVMGCFIHLRLPRFSL